MQAQDRVDSAGNRRNARVYRVDDLVVDTARVTVSRADRELALPELSFDLLIALIEAAPRVVSPDELMDRVWSGLVADPEVVSQCIKLLRDSLGDDAKTPRYVADVSGGGYRLLPEVVLLDLSGQSAAAVRTTTPVPAMRARWQVFLPLLALGIAITAGLWLLLDRSRAAIPADDAISTAQLPDRSVAVLAFEDRGGAPGTGILAIGIPESVLQQLARYPRLTVIARSSSFAFRDRPQDLHVIGRRLNVRYLLEGSVQTAETRLRVTASLVDTQSGASVWSRQFDRAPGEVFAMQDEITIEVARAMQLTPDSGDEAVASPPATTSYDAYLAFLRGRMLLANSRVADLPAAVESLSAAIRHDPGFAAAYVLLARARVSLAEQKSAADSTEKFEQALERGLTMLDTAIALDPMSGEAYVERGRLRMYLDPGTAEADLRRGVELSPNYARGHEGLAAVLFQSVSRRREALETLDRARRLDPLASRLDVLKATYLAWGPGEMAESARLLEAVLERHPLYLPAMIRLADVRWRGEGGHSEAIQLLEQAVALDPGDETAWRQLALGYLDVGDLAAASSALGNQSVDPDHLQLQRSLFLKDWPKAGETAYAMIAKNPSRPQIEPHIALAIRRHARETGEYRRAITALERWASVSWQEGEPVLERQLDTGHGVAGLADMLLADGQKAKATALLEALLADTDRQINEYGRGEVWVSGGRAIAFALLNRPDEAVATLQRQAERHFARHAWRVAYEDEPAFDSLRKRKDFQALLAEIRSHSARERRQLQLMRSDGLAPDRG